MATKAKSDRQLVMSILRKMQIDFTAKISEERAKKKLVRAIEKGTPAPKNLDHAEIGYLRGWGIQVEATEEPKQEPKQEVKQEPAVTNEAPVNKEVQEPKQEPKRKVGALAHFKKLWEENEQLKRQDIIDGLMALFGEKSQWAGANYIAKAKKDIDFLGFLLVEFKDTDGVKTIKKQ